MSDYDPNYVPVQVDFFIGVKVIVVNPEGKVLLLQRSDKVSRAHGWDFCGGGVDKGEDPATAAIRETHEEAGIEIVDPRPLTTHTFVDKNWDNTVVIICYWAKTKSDGIKLSWEHESFQWVSHKEAQRLQLPPAYHEFLRAYREQATA